MYVYICMYDDLIENTREFFPPTLLLLVSTRCQSLRLRLGEFSTAFRQFFRVLKRVVRGVFETPISRENGVSPPA